MSELTIDQLIKIILGVLVVIAVIIGLYLFFGQRVADFFKGLSPPTSVGGFWRILYG